MVGLSENVQKCMRRDILNMLGRCIYSQEPTQTVRLKRWPFLVDLYDIQTQTVDWLCTNRLIII